MEGHATREELDRQIRQSRRLNADGSRVVYDLTHDVDFSKPRATAEAVARVVWHEDVQGWWSMKDGSPVCAPSRMIELRIPSEDNRKVAKVVDEFKKDLMSEELADHFGLYLSSRANYDVDWPTVFLLGPFWAYVLEGSENRRRHREELQYLFSQMSRYIRISPQ